LKINFQKGGDGLKIRVAYTEDEREKKRLLEWAVKRLFSDTRVKETTERDGFLHTVLTVPKSNKTLHSAR